MRDSCFRIIAISIRQRLLFLLLAALVLTPAIGAEEDFSFGDIFFPNLHGFAVLGDSTGDPTNLALNGHHPSCTGFNLLALEPAVSMRLGDDLEGIVVNYYLTDATGHFTGGNEEAFLKLENLPGDLEIHCGRYFKD